MTFTALLFRNGYEAGTHEAKASISKPTLKNKTKPEPLFLENSIKRLNHPISVKQSAVGLFVFSNGSKNSFTKEKNIFIIC